MMNKISKPTKERLEQYVSYLDRMIELEKNRLERVRSIFLPKGMNPDGLTPKTGSVEVFQAAAKPISEVMQAYVDAKGEVCRLFPELLKK